MKSDKLQDAIGEIRDDYIADAHGEVKKRRYGAVWGAVAACLCLAAGAVYFLGLGGETPVDPVVPKDYYIPSAELASSVFDIAERDGLKGTNQYTKVYANDVSELAPELFEAPDELEIYKTPAQAPDKDAAETFFRAHLSQFQELTGVSTSDYELCEDDYDGAPVYTAFVEETGNNSFKLIMLSARSGDMCIYNGGSERMKHDGDPVFFPSAADDETITASLADLAAYLNSLFGTDHSEMRVIREYSYDGLREVRVYLYSHSEADRIEMVFNTDWGEGRAYHWGEDKTYAYLTRVALHESFGEKENSVIGTGRALSLSEAEELLYKGHVFGGHSCPLCMAAQDAVDFEGYDAVSLEYVTGGGYSVPFYAFFKSLGVNEYGMPTFAKTYVCAVELGGTEEYFEAQTAYHGVTDLYAN